MHLVLDQLPHKAELLIIYSHSVTMVTIQITGQYLVFNLPLKCFWKHLNVFLSIDLIDKHAL